MILADTSVWIDHLYRNNAALAAQLQWGQIASHPAVIGELACGTFRDRMEVLGMLKELPAIAEAENEEALALIERHKLMGMGIGWVDVHLLASATLNDVSLWTLDKRLAQAAATLGVVYAD